MVTIYCPTCGKKAKTTNTKYGCKNYCQACNLWSWGESPLVDSNTHAARIKAHQAFDIIWKSKLMKRSVAYAWLTKSLGIPPKECHMKLMTKEIAEKVVLICRNFNKLSELCDKTTTKIS